jgi:hypothetical protein
MKTPAIGGCSDCCATGCSTSVRSARASTRVSDLPDAVEAASTAGKFECIVGPSVAPWIAAAFLLQSQQLFG